MRTKHAMIEIWHETLLSRKKVGTITRRDGKYILVYDEAYLNWADSTPLGPDLPLSKQIHVSKSFWTSLNEALPPRDTAHYKDYCDAAGIDIKETDPLILLSTVGKRGASSFVFEIVHDENTMENSAKFLRYLQKEAKLSLADIALMFNIPKLSIFKLLHGQLKEPMIPRLISLYQKYPDMTLSELSKNTSVSASKKERLMKVLRMGNL